MTEKIILVKEQEAKAVKPIFIGVEVHAQLLDLKAETGISLSKIVDKFIRFGLTHCEIKEEE